MKFFFLHTLLIFTSSLIFAQTTESSVIDRPGSPVYRSWFGREVEAGGDFLLIRSGAQTNIYNALPVSFVVYVYELQENGYVFKQTLFPSALYRGGFGISMDISEDGKTIVVGQSSYSVDASEGGAVWIFNYNEALDKFEEVDMLAPTDAQIKGYFGASVAIHNDKILVGAPGYDKDQLNVDIGKFYLYTLTNSGEWEFTFSIDDTFLPQGSRLGSGVDLSDYYMVAGAVDYGETDDLGYSLPPVGLIRLYDYTGNIAFEYSPTFSNNNRVGRVMNILDTTLVFGYYGRNDQAEPGGAFVVERKNGVFKMASLPSGLVLDIDKYGVSADIKGNYIIVGASLAETSPFSENGGAAFVFERIDTGWIRIDTLIASSKNAQDYQSLGTSVAFAGSKAIVSAANYDTDTHESVGRIFVYNDAIDLCKDVYCPIGDICIDGVCYSPCDLVTCPIGQICVEGECIEPWIRGAVYSETDRLPIEGVLIQGIAGKDTTDGNGFFEVNGTGGLEDIYFSKLGYRDFSKKLKHSNDTNKIYMLEDACNGVVCAIGQTCFNGECFEGKTISGYITDAESQEPIANVKVIDSFFGREAAISDSNGYYEVDIISYPTKLEYNKMLYEKQSKLIDPYTSQANVQLLFDVCAGVVCPIGEVCYEGSCYSYNSEMVYGTVYDSVSGEPLNDVEIRVAGSDTVFYTIENGSFDIPLILGAAVSFYSSSSYYMYKTKIGTDWINNSKSIFLKRTPCYDVLCPIGDVCYEGACYKSDSFQENESTGCETKTCPIGEVCYAGNCYDPYDQNTFPYCEDVVCPDGQACYGGSCYKITDLHLKGNVKDEFSKEAITEFSIRYVNPIDSSLTDSTFTNTDGNYVLSALEHSQIIVSAEGYLADTIVYSPLMAGSSLNFLLTPDLCFGITCPQGQVCYEGSCYDRATYISQQLFEAIDIYPIPAENDLILQNLPDDVSIVIYNPLGRKVRSFISESSTVSLNITDLTNGIYLVHIFNSNGSFIKKIVIE